MLTSFYEVIRLLGGQFLLTYHIFVHSKNDFILRDFFYSSYLLKYYKMTTASSH